MGLGLENMSARTGDCAARRLLKTRNPTFRATRMILPSLNQNSSSFSNLDAIPDGNKYCAQLAGTGAHAFGRTEAVGKVMARDEREETQSSAGGCPKLAQTEVDCSA